MEALVETGWFRDRDTLLADALRRYLESHCPDLLARFAREDDEWGCVAGSEPPAPAVLDTGPIIHLDEIDALDLLADFAVPAAARPRRRSRSSNTFRAGRRSACARRCLRELIQDVRAAPRM